MVGWAVCPLPFALLPQKPVQLHAVWHWTASLIMPLLQSSPDLLNSLNGAGPDLHFFLTPS